MHALIELDTSDLRYIQEEIMDLKNIIEEMPMISDQSKKFIKKFDYILSLKLNPFLQ